MKVKVEKFENQSKVKLIISFTKEEYDAKYQEELAKCVQEAELPGFRKGKVPTAMYLKRFGEAKVINNTMDELINSSYFEAIQAKKIKAVGYPQIDLAKAPKGGFAYSAEVSVLPEVVAKDYLGIEATKEDVVVTDEELEKEVNRNLANSADLEVVEDGAIEKGNVAVFDFCGSVDGVEFEGGKAENYSLEIGSGQFIPGFEDQMLGMKNGEEKVVKVKFPEEYHASDLAGKDAEFKVVVHEIKKRVLPELNEDYVKGLEIEGVETVDAYKAMLKENLEKEKAEASKNKFEDDVLTKLLENNPVDIPQEMVDTQINNKVAQLEAQAKQYGLTADLLLKYQGVESVEQYKELLAPGIKTSIQEEFVLDAIVKAEKLKLDKEDYEKYYAQIAEYQHKEVKEVKAKLPKSEVKDRFLLFKARDLVLESVVLK